MPTPLYLYSLNFPNGKKYIGVSTKPKHKRIYQHCEKANKGLTHPLYAAIRKYGKPKVLVLCAGSADYISDLEIKAITIFRTQDRKFGYNIAFGGHSPHPPEVRARIGAANRGRQKSPEWRAKISAAKRGKPSYQRTPESRLKMSLALKGRIIAPEWRAKISETLTGKPGHPSTPETNAKIRAAHLGRKRTPEHQANITAALNRPEVRAKLKAPKSPEHQAKITASLRAFHAARRLKGSS